MTQRMSGQLVTTSQTTSHAAEPDGGAARDDVSPALEGAPSLPGWCDGFAGIDARAREEATGSRVSIRRGERGGVVSAVIDEAVMLGPDELEARVAEVYGEIAATLERYRSRSGGELRPVRFWNFIPGIHDRMREGDQAGGPAEVSRYMVFNAGRFRAIERWRELGAAKGSRLGGGIAAATGVGYRGRDLWIHCLAVERNGRAVENPRQVPAYRYSGRYGPVPPCFARGTVAEGPEGPVLLVGGTASVRGEASVHGSGAPGDLDAQIQETLTNISSLIETGLGNDGPPALERMTEVRVYHLGSREKSWAERVVRGALRSGARVEFVRADICRPELLIEIEGVAV